MEQRLANTWRMTVNEKKFIETALKSDLRIDGRRPFDYRVLSIKFGREDGSSEVQLGQTHVMGFVTAQLVQPYKDRPNEGTLSIYTEFSPMADPSFEVGRPGEAAVELGRIIDRGLRESRAVDTESLCVLAGKLVWSIRIDLHIIDNGGNLVDASNIAALAALLTFRRSECTLGGDDGQEVIIHPPEVKDPIPLIIHHLPIAITFSFFGDENTVVVDPTHNEEAIMGGRMTATLNTNGDVCAIQKGGGVGVLDSVIMQCLRIASVKAADITSKIKKAVELLDTERALRKIKLHTPSVALDICGSNFKFKGRNQSTHLKGDGKSPSHHIGELNLTSEETGISTKNDIQSEAQSSEQGGTTKRDSRQKNFTTSSWDPYSKGVDVESLKSSLASHGVAQVSKQEDSGEEKLPEVKQEDPIAAVKQAQQIETVTVEREIKEVKTLKDAVKPKNKRKKNHQAREVN